MQEAIIMKSANVSFSPSQMFNFTLQHLTSIQLLAATKKKKKRERGVQVTREKNSLPTAMQADFDIADCCHSCGAFLEFNCLAEGRLGPHA